MQIGPLFSASDFCKGRHGRNRDQKNHREGNEYRKKEDLRKYWQLCQGIRLLLPVRVCKDQEHQGADLFGRPGLPQQKEGGRG
jgi:hypothetical protein